ncbi:MAG: glycogen synthase [Oscillospiraceae bacterium]|jgi:starch synthase|nr:glycogen synthase [Oscillospiraceae bacterium]
MNILFAAFEAAPFAKSGGLGDVAGSLPAALNALGHDCRVMMPKHGGYETAPLTSFRVRLGWRDQYCGIEKAQAGGVTYYFIDNEYYFRRESIYGYDDDTERVAFFSKAAAESLDRLGDFRPDVVHCNDWHAALIPLFLAGRAKTVMTIHNLRFQGACPMWVTGDMLGLEDDEEACAALRWHDGANFLKAGIVRADRVTTVSPSYAEEICTEEYGEGLDPILRMRRDALCGILNGIDGGKWAPCADKSELCSELGLGQDEKAPLFAMVSRLTEQKGVELVLECADRLIREGGQLAVLGTGREDYEKALTRLAERYPGKVSVCIRFDEELSHRMFSGADFVLVPSLFEPCGLTQMMAMRCGSVPIVRRTGGLKDSVADGVNGIVFNDADAEGLRWALSEAMGIYGTDKYREMRENAMKCDFSWSRSAEEYIRLYESIS